MPIRHKSTFAKIVEKVESLNRRAEKRGLAPAFSITVEREFSVRTKGTYEYEDFVEFHIDGVYPAISGYTFAAVVDHASGGLIFRNPLFTEDVDLTPFADRKTCDHCGTKRKRSKTILLSDAAGKIIQVGTSCIIDFLGKEAGALEFFAENSGILGDSDDDGHYASSPHYATVEICSIAVKLISDFGFVKSNTPGGTAARIMDFVDEHYRSFPRDYDFTVTAEHTEQAIKAIEFIKNSERRGEYQENVFRVMTSGRCEKRVFGFIAAGIRGALADIRKASDTKKLEEKTEEKITVEFPAIGTIVANEEVTIEKIFTFEGMYGEQHIFIMKSSAGIPFVWKTSTFPDVEEGGTYTIKKAKVKAHDDYKGKSQCRLERVSFILQS
jgi:hypothetical protein|nr:MAG TPA: hypothetical protein [Caudoviricetes sp.]